MQFLTSINLGIGVPSSGILSDQRNTSQTR